jgi:hypothetical protein
MTEALIEDDPRRMDPDDVAAVLAALDDIAVSAEAVERRVSGPKSDWTLRLRWLQRGPVSADTEAALPNAFSRIREHFLTTSQEPPARLELTDPDGELLLSVPTEGQPR